MPNTSPVLLLFIMLCLACHKQGAPSPAPRYAWDEFSMGADLSYVNQLEDNGAVYRESGRIRDPFSLFKNHGGNTVRVRLWHTPDWQMSVTGGRRYSDLADVEQTIRRARSLGMAVNLDLHYSDIWADPGRQETPAAWAGLSMPVLQDSVYAYTLRVLQHLAQKGLTPEMIQIGNETNTGMLHPLGAVQGQDFGNFGRLLRSGIRAVRDFSDTSAIKPQVILHVAQWQHVHWWLEGVVGSGGVSDFDIIGVSHYPAWSTVNSMAEIESIIRNLISSYGKKVMIVETAYLWTSLDGDAYPNIIDGKQQVLPGYPPTRAGQLSYLKDLTQAVFRAGGCGVLVWEPAWISTGMRDLWGVGSPWDNACFFDYDGELLPAIRYMEQEYSY